MKKRFLSYMRYIICMTVSYNGNGDVMHFVDIASSDEFNNPIDERLDACLYKKVYAVFCDKTQEEKVVTSLKTKEFFEQEEGYVHVITAENFLSFPAKRPGDKTLTDLVTINYKKMQSAFKRYARRFANFRQQLANAFWFINISTHVSDTIPLSLFESYTKVGVCVETNVFEHGGGLIQNNSHYRFGHNLQMGVGIDKCGFLICRHHTTAKEASYLKPSEMIAKNLNRLNLDENNLVIRGYLSNATLLGYYIYVMNRVFFSVRLARSCGY